MKSYLMITGATGGLGSAFVLEAARMGFDLYLTDRVESGATVAARVAEKYKIDVCYRPCDLAEASEREKFFQELKKEGISFWGLVNVAGLDHEGIFLEKTREQIMRILTINVVSTTDMMHGILSLRDPEKKFRLINVGSLAGFYPMPFKATYAASKRFLLDLSRALHEEIREFGSVTILCPAGMPTRVDCMRSMFAQGFWGLATSVNPDVVARQTLHAALRGRTLVIPGFLNQVIHALSSLVPSGASIKYVAKRWKKARADLASAQAFHEGRLETEGCSFPGSTGV